MTGRQLLESLLSYRGHDPSKLDKEIIATFGNDDGGNATPITVEASVSVADLRVNGLDGLAGGLGLSDLVLLLNDEGKENNPVACDRLTVYYVPTYATDSDGKLGKPFCVDHDEPTEDDSVGFRFRSPHLATDHIREWLYRQEDLADTE